MIVKERTNHYHCTEAHPIQSIARHRFSLFDFEIPFRLPSAACLLCSVMSCFVSCYSITDCSVGNKYINILGIV